MTANELHVPLSDPQHPTPTFLTLTSADTDHSFWVPRLAGKTDLIPNRANSMWIDPHETGLYLGQCAQYCGTQHAKMLLRVYVQNRARSSTAGFKQQSQPAHVDDAAYAGRRIFETTACVNCHTVTGTTAHGRFGPDLTHLMSRDTIASGAVPNTPGNLQQWIRNPDVMKPGSQDAGDGIGRSGRERGDRLSGDTAVSERGASDVIAAVSPRPQTRRWRRHPLVSRLHEWVTTVDHKRLGVMYIRLWPGLSGARRASKRRSCAFS